MAPSLTPLIQHITKTNEKMKQIDMQKAYNKRAQWFSERVGQIVYRPPVKCECQSCKDGHLKGVLIADEMHADYLHSCECELGFRYSEKRMPI